MARLEGLIKLNGTVGDLSFYKTKANGTQVRMKGGVSGDRIANDPAFVRTRENGAEFGRAQQLGKKLRELLRDALFQNADSRFSYRLANRLLKVIQMDNVQVRGERTLIAENMILLQDLECNERASLSGITLKPVSFGYDRSTGEGTLACDQLIPKHHISQLAGATHVQYTLVLQEFSGDETDLRPVIQRSAFIDLNEVEPVELEVMASLTADASKTVILLASTGYYQHVNGAYYPLANGLYNAMTVKRVYVP